VDAQARRLYAIIDVETCELRGLHVLDFARQVFAAQPRIAQLRAKRSTARETLELLRGLVGVARQQGVLVFANDRPDLALLAGADGVHVGQDDLPLSVVRTIAPNLRLGVSTHSEAQLRQALIEAPDYVAIGPIYNTVSKQDAQATVGLVGLVAAARITRAANIPLVAIGGIEESRIGEVAAHADWIAVISALLPKSGRLADVTAHVQALNQAIARHPS
jgi:thiamine-phosphate pyrophosphorylase